MQFFCVASERKARLGLTNRLGGYHDEAVEVTEAMKSSLEQIRSVCVVSRDHPSQHDLRQRVDDVLAA